MSLLARLRSRIRDRIATRLGVPEIPRTLARLAAQGFRPATILDVGAYRGDFAALCRQLWPSARIACVEPLQARAAELRQRMGPAVPVHEVLLGAEDRTAVPFFEYETGSSVLPEHVRQPHPAVPHPMRRLDALAGEDFGGRGPELLKLDVQGYELEVLRGAQSSLRDMRAILAEVNFIDLHEGAPLLAPLVAWLEERNFVAFDICGLTRRPLDGALWQADLLFVPRDSPLRADKRWRA